MSNTDKKYYAIGLKILSQYDWKDELHIFDTDKERRAWIDKDPKHREAAGRSAWAKRYKCRARWDSYNLSSSAVRKKLSEDFVEHTADKPMKRCREMMQLLDSLDTAPKEEIRERILDDLWVGPEFEDEYPIAVFGDGKFEIDYKETIDFLKELKDRFPENEKLHEMLSTTLAKHLQAA